MIKEPIYLSGPMTGLPDYNKPAFHAAANRLRLIGYEVINPADVILNSDATWEHYMRVDLKLLMDCQSVIVLPGWENSRGAKLEVDLAKVLKIPVFSLGEVLRHEMPSSRLPERSPGDIQFGAGLSGT